MTKYLHDSHNLFLLHVHVVWITKYRKKVLTGEVSLALREELKKICKSETVEIIRGHVSSDYVHLFLSYPPKICLSKLVQRLKGASAHKLLMQFQSLQKQYWGRHLWARGYFCCSSGNITDEMIMKYIEDQNHDDDDDSFKVN
jgi:putative transposase